VPLLGIFLAVAAIGLILAAMIHPDAAHRVLDSVSGDQPSSVMAPAPIPPVVPPPYVDLPPALPATPESTTTTRRSRPTPSATSCTVEP
jgi:hypothetical protein